MALMTKCAKGSSGGGVTSFLYGIILGALFGCLFGLLDTIVNHVLIEEERSSASERVRRSVFEGSIVGAAFGTLFGFLKLMI